jgi:hypothetical protein
MRRLLARIVLPVFLQARNQPAPPAFAAHATLLELFSNVVRAHRLHGLRVAALSFRRRDALLEPVLAAHPQVPDEILE